MAALKNDFSFEEISDSWVNEVAGLLAHSVSLDLSSGSLDISATDDYKVRILLITGTLTANRTITLPADSGRVWLVVNGASGAFTCTVKTSGGAGIVVSPGTTMLLRCDGTDILAAQQRGRIRKAITDANQTLTAEEYSRRIIELTGTLSAGRDIVMPNLDSWEWIVKNSTGQTLTFKVSGQTGIAVANGKKATLYCDGADIARATADV